MQSASFFLPFILLLDLPDGFLYLNIVLRVLAGLCTFLFLRQFGLSRFASLLAGVLFELNGTFTWLGDAPIHPIPFLPLLMFGIERCRALSITNRPGGQLPVVFGIAFSIVGGFPEVAFSDGVLALAWAVSRLDMERRFWPLYVGKVIGGGVCGLLLSAPALVPFLHDLPSASIGIHVFAQVSIVKVDHLASVMFPAIFGAPYADGNLDGWNNFWGYVTPATALLAILGIVTRPAEPRRLLLVAWVIFCLAGACKMPVLGELREVLPAFNQINFARYVGPSAEFAAVTLAAIALDQWRTAISRISLAIALIVFATLGAATLFLARVLLERDAASNPLGAFMASGSIAEAVVVVSALCVLLSRDSIRQTRLVVGFVSAIEALVVASPTVLSGTNDFQLNTAPVAFLQTHLGLSRFYAVGGSLLPNYGAYFGIGMANEFYVPLPKMWADYVSTLTSLDTPTSFQGAGDTASRISDFTRHRAAFSAMSVEYLVLPGFGDPLAGRHDPQYEPVFDNGRTHIYRLPDAAPYFQVIGGQCSVRAQTRDDVTVDCKQTGQLLRREMASRGWIARVNGSISKVHTAEGVFQSVDVPVGTSRVQWQFLPRYLWILTIAFAAGVTGCAIISARSLRSRGK